MDTYIVEFRIADRLMSLSDQRAGWRDPSSSSIIQARMPYGLALPVCSMNKPLGRTPRVVGLRVRYHRGGCGGLASRSFDVGNLLIERDYTACKKTESQAGHLPSSNRLYPANLACYRDAPP